jgi:hypothetical protein
MSAINAANVSIPQTSSVTTPNPVTSFQAYLKQRRPEVQQLKDALQSGDLAAAQQDYTNLVALGNKDLGGKNFLGPDRQLDFNAIGGALQNGDLAGAQQAFASLEATFKHQPAGVNNPSSTSAPAASESTVNVVA